MRDPAKAPGDGHPRLAIRLPPELHQEIREAAEAEERSVNSWAIRAFRAVLQRRDTQELPER